MSPDILCEMLHMAINPYNSCEYNTCVVTRCNWYFGSRKWPRVIQYLLECKRSWSIIYLHFFLFAVGISISGTAILFAIGYGYVVHPIISSRMNVKRHQQFFVFAHTELHTCTPKLLPFNSRFSKIPCHKVTQCITLRLSVKLILTE